MAIDRRDFLGAAAVGAISVSDARAASAPPMPEYQRLDATALAAEIRRGRITPIEALDAAIATVGEKLKGVNHKNRVTVYYLLADHFGQLGLFG